jgi:quinol-cytochrome oxidoreductase complex cytochrome b subunit
MSEEKENNAIPFFPDHVALEAKVALGFAVLLVIVGIIGIFLPVGLQEPADPMETPAHTKPEWYFLFLYQLLKFIPKTIGAMAPVIAILILAIWPFIDRKPDKDPRAIRIRLIISLALILIIIGLTIWGEVT